MPQHKFMVAIQLSIDMFPNRSYSYGFLPPQPPQTRDTTR